MNGRFLFILAYLALSIFPTNAQQTVCGEDNIYYSSLDDGVHIVQSATCTLTDIYARVFLAEPLELVDSQNKIWYLKANLFVEHGATFLLHGDASGGDVNELRLKSANDDSENAFIEVVANYGTIDIRDTRIRSYDPNTGEPDTNYENGRANIRAMSFLDRWNTPRESTMNIDNSDLSYLGYLAGESYGVSWKVKDKGDISILDFVGVYGTVQNSIFHHNYFGAYSYGAEAMQWLNNEFHSNVEYGLDPHDDSDNLLIEGNYAHDNGNHGIICSKRCDNLIIRNNVSNNNDGHGIMLHHDVVDSVVEENVTQDNSNAGIAIFDSHHNIIRNNTSTGNMVGLRVWMGSSGNEFSNNTFSENTDVGIYLHQGTGEPLINDGRPNNNQFVNNVISANGQNAIKLKEADNNLFNNNQIIDNTNGGIIYSEQPSGNIFDANTFTNNGDYSLRLEATVNTHIIGNNLSGNDVGLYLKSLTTATIEDNIFSSNQVGVSSTDQSAANLIEINHFSDNEYAIQDPDTVYVVQLTDGTDTLSTSTQPVESDATSINLRETAKAILFIVVIMLLILSFVTTR